MNTNPKENKGVSDKGIFTRQDITTEMKQFSEYLDNTFLADRTKRLYKTMVKRFLKDLHNTPRKKDFLECLKKHPRDYTKHALKHYLKSKGIKIDKDFFPKVKEPPKERKDVPERSELKDVLSVVKKYCDMETYLLFKTLYWTGARLHEALAIRTKDIHEKDGTIFFRKIKGSETTREIPVPKDLIKNLKKLANRKHLWDLEEVFYTESKNKESLLRKRRLEKLRKNKPEIYKKISNSHNFRRAVINKIIPEKGLEYAAEFVGHASLNTTKEYVSERTRKDIIKKGAEVLKDE